MKGVVYFWFLALVLSSVAQESIVVPAATPIVAPTPLGPIEHNLVNVGMIYPAPLQEIRYATPYNFTGYTLYPFPTAFIHRDVAVALAAVQNELANEGLGLKIYDGYRPISVQARMWQILPDPKYVSDPNVSKGKHTRGTAVDVTLVDSKGNELKMPTEYDDFTEKAHRTAKKWNREEKANSLKLEAVMKKHGFIPFLYEWWHFDFTGWENYPPLDISFDDLGKGVKKTIPVP